MHWYVASASAAFQLSRKKLKLKRASASRLPAPSFEWPEGPGSGNAEIGHIVNVTPSPGCAKRLETKSLVGVAAMKKSSSNLEH